MQEYNRTYQMSDCTPCPSSLTTSGAIQYGVPLMDLSSGLWSAESDVILRHNFLAHPKSISLIIPLCITMMFPPLMSLFRQTKNNIQLYKTLMLHF